MSRSYREFATGSQTGGRGRLRRRIWRGRVRHRKVAVGQGGGGARGLEQEMSAAAGDVVVVLARSARGGADGVDAGEEQKSGVSLTSVRAPVRTADEWGGEERS